MIFLKWACAIFGLFGGKRNFLKILISHGSKVALGHHLVPIQVTLAPKGTHIDKTLQFLFVRGSVALENSIAYRQNTSKREGRSQSISEK